MKANEQQEIQGTKQEFIKVFREMCYSRRNADRGGKQHEKIKIQLSKSCPICRSGYRPCGCTDVFYSIIAFGMCRIYLRRKYSNESYDRKRFVSRGKGRTRTMDNADVQVVYMDDPPVVTIVERNRAKEGKRKLQRRK